MRKKVNALMKRCIVISAMLKTSLQGLRLVEKKLDEEGKPLMASALQRDSHITLMLSKEVDQDLSPMVKKENKWKSKVG